MRIGIYLRISEDPDGDQTATKRQKADCRRFAKSHGWEVVDIFEDIDTSAFRKGVRRPEFERMLESVRAKDIDGVLAWKMDRITRRQRDLVRLDEACEEAGASILTVIENINTAEPTGRFVAELLVAQARMESENASIRITRKHAEMAKAGKPITGGTRTFGYSKDRMSLVPEEAELVRETVQRIIGGESIRGLTRDWQDRGVQTPTGRAWARTPLRRMLLSPAISAQRALNGELTPGTWPAIISPGDSLRVRAVLEDRAGAQKGSPRRYLLTGFVRCGRCDHKLSTKPRGDGSRRYVCLRQPGEKDTNCGALARLADPVEELVRESLFAALDGVDLRTYMEEPNGNTDELVDAIRVDEEAQQELADDFYVEKRIGRAEFFAARDRLVARIESNRRQLTQANGHGLLNTVVGAGETVREQWTERGLDWQRAILGAVIDNIVLNPAVKGRTGFDPSLVKIVWKF